MIENGQGVDITGISDKSLVALLKKLFRSMKLKQNESGIYLPRQMGLPTLDLTGSPSPHLEPSGNQLSNSGLLHEEQSLPSNAEFTENRNDHATVDLRGPSEKEESPRPTKRRVIGPEMPSRELLAAAAELTEAENLLRDADLEVDNDLLIGPPPPAMVAEVESANEAERFEEVARIAGADTDSPYDVLGINWKMSSDNIKKRYWKLSLMVHPDKCSHPQAHQAFVILNKAFKDLQDPDKRKAIDQKIEEKEEQEKFKVELKALQEAAQWRRLQGISIEGDEELLAVGKEAPKPSRDEWMTTLPPERKPGMTMHSTSFSRTGKEGRGDTSMWTDNPLDKAQKAKQNYIEAYNKAKALAEADDENKKTSSDAALVDKYNSSKRSVPLVQKHREESSSKQKNQKQKRKQQKQQQESEKEEWEGNHPWKPWDREKDLVAGRQRVNFDQESMVQGLTSRFSSGSVQRNFL
ncbi:GPALPP motifs-containing protein 1 [Ananas comosus]|nr:GPALPP motifs-containing protein 1 [Ananas comosus]